MEECNMLKSYKILSLLLDYPTKETQELLPLVMPYLEEEKLLNKSSLRDMRRFVDIVGKLDLLDWQEIYTKEFDYASSSSLYLFDQVYGDSKRRGMAMVDLKQLYASEGMEIATGELPDYLPVLLEFIASTQSPEKGADLLAEAINILKKIEGVLRKGDCFYHYLFTGLVYLASTGNAKPLTEEERVELERMHACETCFFKQQAEMAEEGVTAEKYEL